MINVNSGDAEDNKTLSGNATHGLPLGKARRDVPDHRTQEKHASFKRAVSSSPKGGKDFKEGENDGPCPENKSFVHPNSRREARFSRGPPRQRARDVDTALFNEIDKLRGENDGLREAARSRADDAREQQRKIKEEETLLKKAAKARSLLEIKEMVEGLNVKFGTMVIEQRKWNYVYLVLVAVGLAVLILVPEMRIPGAACLLMGLYMCRSVEYINVRRYRYAFRGFVESSEEDRRPDCLATSEYKHVPLLARVLYEDHEEEISKELLVSLELLSQIAVAKNLVLGSEDKVAWARIQSTSIAVDTVNLDRYLALCGKFVVQNTQLVCFGLYKQMTMDLAACPFPMSPEITAAQ